MQPSGNTNELNHQDVIDTLKLFERINVQGVEVMRVALLIQKYQALAKQKEPLPGQTGAAFAVTPEAWKNGTAYPVPAYATANYMPRTTSGSDINVTATVEEE